MATTAAVPDERRETVAAVRLLATEVGPRDEAMGLLLGRFAEAVEERRPDEAKAYAAVLEPRVIAESLLGGTSGIWSVFEVARNVVIFLPIAVTWYGLATASAGYAELLTKDPSLAGLPFLLLWQESFRGTGSVISFSTLATIDASLIGLLIALSLALNAHSEVRDTRLRSRILLRESEIRGLVGHALSLASTSDLDAVESGAVLDQMIAEERRIYERAREGEQQLFQLEAAVGELRQAAMELTRAAGALNARIDLPSSHERPPSTAAGRIGQDPR